MDRKKNEPVTGPGDEFMNQSATGEEVKKGDFTLVTRLSYDEVGPG